MTFLDHLPPELINLLKELELKGFAFCLVGGAPRDFLLSKKISKDLDFEVRGRPSSELISYLEYAGLKVQELPYDIYRVKFKDFDLEFSSPRTEIQLPGNSSHHHFKAVLDKSLDYKDSFKRRDFTINSIGLEINFQERREVIKDPFGGVKDLELKILREVSDYFYSDSVRFLRLIRFHLTLNFTINMSLYKKLSLFDLSLLPDYHFKEELRKSHKLGEFLYTFKKMVIENKINYNPNHQFFIDNDFNRNSLSLTDLLIDSFSKSKKHAEFVVTFFSLPEKILKSLESFNQSYLNVTSYNEEKVKALLTDCFENFNDIKLLKDLKNIEDKKEWLVYYHAHFLINIDFWKDIKIDQNELVKFPNELRSYYRFYKALNVKNS
ncbi:MAG: hypothetical protein HOP07_02770 [Bacteriovoracaceae bacterium]|nr:hypothetical protein [Bacteriovoracaceae bacterium]